MGFGHIGEILLLLLLALVVFGPKRMIEMVVQLGKSALQARDALREMNWSLTSGEEDTPTTPVASEMGARDPAPVVESAPRGEPTGDE